MLILLNLFNTPLAYRCTPPKMKFLGPFPIPLKSGVGRELIAIDQFHICGSKLGFKTLSIFFFFVC